MKKVICPIYSDSDTMDEKTKHCDDKDCPHRFEHKHFYACSNPECPINKDNSEDRMKFFKSCACVEVG